MDRSHRFAACAFLLALVLRLVPVLLAPDLPIGLDDMFQYDMLARSIAAGRGYRWYAQEDLDLIQRYLTMDVPAEYDPQGVPTSFRPPGYPAFLSLIYIVAGSGEGRFFAARLVQAIVGATLAPIVWALARAAGFGDRPARWAAGTIAVFPLLVLYPLALATENLYVVLLALALLLVLRAAEKRRLRDYALAGLVLGAAALTRSIVAAFVPLVAVWLWRASGEGRSGLRGAAVVVCCCLLVATPWAVRNSLLHGRPTWVESSLGYDLYMGYHPSSSGTFQFGISLDLLPMLDDGARNAAGMEAFWEFVTSDPGRVPYLMLRKAGYLWGLDRRALTFFYAAGFLGHLSPLLLGLIHVLACGPLIVLAPAAVAGLVCGPMERGKALLATLVSYYTAVHMLILAEPRFHVPLLPVVAILAAHAYVDRPWRASRPWQRCLAAGLVALLILNWGFEIARDWQTLVALFGPEGHQLQLSY
jgi:4-amino-4-deoxy-L-arabinose transferase-like glycosyltransferase